MNLALTDLSTLLALPDPEAAEALSQRMAMLDQVHRAHERSFYERGVIALEFERRQLWRHLVSPETGDPFPSLTAWIHSGALGGSRWTFKAKEILTKLADVPVKQLSGIPTGTLYELVGMSTSVRNDPHVLAAARALPTKVFVAKMAREQPGQHISPKSKLEKALEMCQALESCSRKKAEELVGECYIAEHAAAYEETKA